MLQDPLTIKLHTRLSDGDIEYVIENFKQSI